MLQALSTVPGCPVYYDEESKAFCLSSSDGSHMWLLRYCFFCGGSIPEQLNDDAFVEMDDNDVRSVGQATSGIREIHELIRRLEHPDRCTDAKGEPVDPVSRMHPDEVVYFEYTKFWRTLDLVVVVSGANLTGIVCRPKRKEKKADTMPDG